MHVQLKVAVVSVCVCHKQHLVTSAARKVEVFKWWFQCAIMASINLYNSFCFYVRKYDTYDSRAKGK